MVPASPHDIASLPDAITLDFIELIPLLYLFPLAKAVEIGIMFFMNRRFIPVILLDACPLCLIDLLKGKMLLCFSDFLGNSR